MLNNFVKEHTYRLSQISSRVSNITIHTLRNIMDVRFWEDGAPKWPWCISLELGLIWRWQGGCRGWGSYRRQKPWATEAPSREDTIIFNSWSWWLGPEIIRWQENVHFSVKDVSLVWWRLFLLRRRQWWPTSVLLSGKTQGWRSLIGCNPWGR